MTFSFRCVLPDFIDIVRQKNPTRTNDGQNLTHHVFRLSWNMLQNWARILGPNGIYFMWVAASDRGEAIVVLESISFLVFPRWKQTRFRYYSTTLWNLWNIAKCGPLSYFQGLLGPQSTIILYNGIQDSLWPMGVEGSARYLLLLG